MYSICTQIFEYSYYEYVYSVLGAQGTGKT